MIIKSSRIYLEEQEFNGYLVIEDHKIKDILPASANLKADIDYKNLRIIPGIFDVHNHGTCGYSLMGQSSNEEQEIKGYLKGLASQGVTNILPTASTNLFKELARLAKTEVDGAKILGIHSEGPYLNRVGEKGVDTGHPEIDLKFLETMVKDSDGYLKMVGIAPELKGSEAATKYLISQNVRVAYTHSNCNYEEAMAAFERGVSVSTHTANVMSGIHHRHMGGLGACLLNPNVECEIICDGLHVSIEMLDLMFRVKPFNKWMMISDSTPMANAPVGKYSMGDFMGVNISEDGFCLSDTGRLCGSSKSVLYGMGNLVEKLNLPLTTVSKMASLNPCCVFGFDHQKGSISKGKDADMVVIDDHYHALYTYSEGRKVYDYELDGVIFNEEFVKNNKI